MKSLENQECVQQNQQLEKENQHEPLIHRIGVLVLLKYLKFAVLLLLPLYCKNIQYPFWVVSVLMSGNFYLRLFHFDHLLHVAFAKRSWFFHALPTTVHFPLMEDALTLTRELSDWSIFLWPFHPSHTEQYLVFLLYIVSIIKSFTLTP